MPKRQLISLDALAEWDWLSQCAVRAAKGKMQRVTVQSYFSTFEQSTSQVREALLHSRMPVGGYNSFTIRDPKPRTIHAAPFADRVAHHALIGKMASRFEQSWISSSYACRPGKGSHAAIVEALSIARSSRWIVKLDVHSYFAYVDHEILRILIHRLFKGQGLYLLIDEILKSYCVARGRGLPIGALTSQYFANHYLDEFQRILRNHSGVNAELRYMDDVWIGCNTRRAARGVVERANDWLQLHRKLQLKPAIIQRSSIGLPFCGFHINTTGLRLGLRRKRSMLRQYRELNQRYSYGDISELAAQSQLCAIVALAKPGDHASMTRRIVHRSGVNELC